MKEARGYAYYLSLWYVKKFRSLDVSGYLGIRLAVHVKTPRVQLVISKVEGKTISSSTFDRIYVWEYLCWSVIVMAKSMASVFPERMHFTRLAENNREVLSAFDWFGFGVAIEGFHLKQGANLLVALVLEFPIRDLHFLPTWQIFI
jgi:hypothetical protein